MPKLSLSRNESLRIGPLSISSIISRRDFLSIDRLSHICQASSAEAGPTPTIPLSLFSASSTRNRIARLKPRPSLIVTAVSTIRCNRSSSSVPLIAELMKNSRESS